MAPPVDIIILAYNKYRYTEFCLRSVLLTSYRPLHVICIDNGSEDRTEAVLAGFEEQGQADNIQVTLITNMTNTGAIQGRNQALEHCSGEYVLFLDNDVVAADRNWVDMLTGFFSLHPNAGAVSPKLIYPVEPYLIQCAGCDVSPTGKVNFRGRGEDRNEPRFNRTCTVQSLISACMAVPASVIRQTGKFDTLFSPVQYEDIDYCYRIKELGLDLFYYADLEMYHFENVTTSRSRKLNSAYNTVKNGMKFKRKWEHVFSRENGPEQASMEWKDIKTVDISDIDSKIFPNGSENPKSGR